MILHRPPARGPLVRATAAATLLLALLGSGSATTARWSDETPLAVGTISTGTLDVALERPTATLRHHHLDPQTGEIRPVTTDLTGQAAVPGALAPGDTVVVGVRARLAIEAADMAATLTVDPAAGHAVVPHVEVTPAPGATPLIAESTGSGWSVTPAHDGAVYDITVSYRVPSTPPTGGGPVVAGPVTIALTQN